MEITEHTRSYFEDVGTIARTVDQEQVERMVDLLSQTRDANGRLFILGVGGSAGNAGHAVNDFRKLANIEAYAPTDNVSELTARTNDEGWTTVFAAWLRVSKVRTGDLVMVLSVGGGDAEKNISANIVEGLKVAKAAGARIIGIVGRNGGYTRSVADACLLIPTTNPQTVTPHAESFQAVVWHCLVTHPKLLHGAMKWESARP